MNTQSTFPGFEKAASVSMECRIALASELFAEALRLECQGFSVDCSAFARGVHLVIMERTTDCGPQLPAFVSPDPDNFSRESSPQWFEGDFWFHPRRVHARITIDLRDDGAPQLLDASLALLNEISTRADLFRVEKERLAE